MTEPDLSFNKAFELVLASEFADQNAKDLRGNNKAIDCPHKSSECHKCGKKGHLADMCRSKKQVIKEPRPRQDSMNSQATHMLTEDTDEYSLYNLTGSTIQPLVVTVKINNADLKMELDTVASINYLQSNLQSTLVTRTSCRFTRISY